VWQTFCLQMPYRRRDLRRHEQTHISASLCAFMTCGRCFRWKHTLMTHIRRVHLAASFICSTCSQRFYSTAALMRHSMTHENSARLIVCDCEQCNKSFIKLCYFRMHQTVHADKTISCAHCKRCFCREAYLLALTGVRSLHLRHNWKLLVYWGFLASTYLEQSA